jgi:hypothetical protein
MTKDQNQQTNLSAVGRNPDGTIKRRPISAEKASEAQGEKSRLPAEEQTKSAEKQVNSQPENIAVSRQAKASKKSVIVGAAVLLVLVILAAGGYFYKNQGAQFLKPKWQLVAGNVAKFFGHQNDSQTVCSLEVKICPDGSSVKRVPPDCQFAACPEVGQKTPVSSQRQIVFSGNLSFLRDAKRMADINRIQKALSAYYQDWGAYPAKLVFGGRLTKGDKIYLSKIPSDPQPESAGYSYRSFLPQAYALFFHLEEGRGQLPKGRIVATPDGIFEVKDTDADGLDDQEEVQYGTDLYSVDTDHDGYGDFDELKSGYNPAGQGRLES